MEYIYLVYAYDEDQFFYGITDECLYAAYSDQHNAERVAQELYNTLIKKDDEFFIGVGVVRFPVDKINFARRPSTLGEKVHQIPNPTHRHHRYDDDGYAFYHGDDPLHE